MTDVSTRLREAGMSAAEAIRKREMFEEVDRALASLGVQPDAAVRYWVPGRIEVLGKHTDYAGGRSLLCAIERGFCFAAIPRPDDILRMHDAKQKPRSIAHNRLLPPA